MDEPSTGTASTEVAVGRQPVVDRERRVVGYELLYRPVQPDALLPSGEQMTVEVVLGALTIGVGQLVGDKLMFCNAERSVLTGDTPLTLPPERTVIELVGSVTVDDEVVDGCASLVAQGYRLALDDFVWVDGAERLLELASIVKLDVRAGSRDEVEELARRCAPYDVRLLAERLETDDEIAWALDLGFDFFQGYAIERPELVRASSLPASVAAQVQLAAALLGEDIDFDELERALRREPGLVVQVLELASIGAARGLRRDITTVREALVVLGTMRIRQWAALTLLSGQDGAGTDGLATALVRARTCELLAESRELGNPEFAFTAGLLSALDVLLGVPLEEIAGTLHLPSALSVAAFHQVGTVGALVAEVTAHQRDLARGEMVEPRPDLDAAFAAAFGWAMPFVASLAAPSAA